MARRGSSSLELRKKREKLTKDLKEKRSKVKFEQNRKNKGGGGTTTTTTTTKKLTGVERAKAMAKARIKSGKTINDLKIANKAAMKARAKAKYEAFKKKRKK